MTQHPLSGRLYTEYYVVCGVCNEEMPVGARTRSLAIFYLEQNGWKETEQKGYVCKECWNVRSENVTSVIPSQT